MPDPAAPASVGSKNDVSFPCDQCGASLIVDRAACGLTLNCQRCGRPTRVPDSTEPPELRAAAAVGLGDLEQQLNENAAQRTEVTGYINQLSIQLHRWQHRLGVLSERRAQLETQIAAAARDSS